MPSTLTLKTLPQASSHHTNSIPPPCRSPYCHLHSKLPHTHAPHNSPQPTHIILPLMHDVLTSLLNYKAISADDLGRKLEEKIITFRQLMIFNCDMSGIEITYIKTDNVMALIVLVKINNF